MPPPLPDDVAAAELHPDARNQLRSLQKENADLVGRHLAMVARLIDDDPALAHEHALAASRTAGRIGVVRETLGITAYQLGDFALALRELRTFRRITGSEEQLPLMVDCERGLGRPERALELARSVDASSLPVAVRVELAIARSGARLDLGQTQAALDELHIPELRKDKAFEHSPALFGAYATVLEELGRPAEAAEWHELADRAIDALQAAYAPGDAETVHVISTVEREHEDDARPEWRGRDAHEPDRADGPTSREAATDADEATEADGATEADEATNPEGLTEAVGSAGGDGEDDVEDSRDADAQEPGEDA